MRFVRQLDKDEVRVLETMRRTAVGRVSQRAHMMVHEDVLKPPSELGHAFAIWTAARLCVHVAVRYGANVCTSTMYGILKGLGLRHNRPRHAAKPGYDPQARAKMNAITEVLSSPIAANHVIYED
ncbi:MAG: winged helix-turn-helix domain-containing protein [Clostridia bacterium]|nr:winged helix-turn-helix domain-containing protein [Clostridia bacterium]